MEVNDLELRISKVLRMGVLLSGVLLLLAWILNTIDGGTSLLIFKDYDRLELLSQLSIAYRNKQWGILIGFLGLGSLILLPVLRVTLTSILFFTQKEHKIGIISLLVLILLFISFLLGFKS
ncbi:MAG: DUF1634 domain-containing protein [Bacteriovoracaceae bacterium]